MRTPLAILTLTLSGLLLGCAKPPPPPGPPPGVNTVADAKVIGDVLQSINTYESAVNRADVSPRLVAADPVGRRGESFVEQWVVDSGGTRVEYEVQLNPSGRGGADYRIKRLTPIGNVPASRIPNLLPSR